MFSTHAPPQSLRQRLRFRNRPPRCNAPSLCLEAAGGCWRLGGEDHLTLFQLWALPDSPGAVPKLDLWDWSSALLPELSCEWNRSQRVFGFLGEPQCWTWSFCLPFLAEFLNTISRSPSGIRSPPHLHSNLCLGWNRPLLNPASAKVAFTRHQPNSPGSYRSGINRSFTHYWNFIRIWDAMKQHTETYLILTALRAHVLLLSKPLQ